DLPLLRRGGGDLEVGGVVLLEVETEEGGPLVGQGLGRDEGLALRLAILLEDLDGDLALAARGERPEPALGALGQLDHLGALARDLLGGEGAPAQLEVPGTHARRGRRRRRTARCAARGGGRKGDR